MKGNGKDAALDAALATFDKLALTEADAYLEEFSQETIAVFGGRVESAENKVGRGIGVFRGFVARIAFPRRRIRFSGAVCRR